MKNWWTVLLDGYVTLLKAELLPRTNSSIRLRIANYADSVEVEKTESNKFEQFHISMLHLLRNESLQFGKEGP